MNAVRVWALSWLGITGLNSFSHGRCGFGFKFVRLNTTWIDILNIQVNITFGQNLRRDML